MKTKLSAAILTMLLYSFAGVSPVLAHAGHNGSEPSTGVAQTADGEGTIKAIDQDAGTVTLAHGPIAALNWPAMTMTFKVESAAVTKDVQVGNTVHFTLQNEGGKPVVTELHAK